MRTQWQSNRPQWQSRAEELESAAEEPAVEAEAEAPKAAMTLNDLVIGDVYKGKVRGVVTFGAFVDIGAEKDGLLHVSDFGEAGYISDASKIISVGQEVEVRIKSVEPSSQKLSLEMNVAARIPLGDLEIGSQVEGTIRNVASFGAFVDVGAEKDGLLHISQLEGFVEDINTVLKAGEKVNVRIAAVDMKGGKITLSQKAEGAGSTRRPRSKQDLSKYTDMKFEDKVSGTVVGIEPYGAFVELEDGTRGLLPISYMDEGRIEKVEDKVKMGETVEMSVLQANTNDGKISFTLVDPSKIASKSNAKGEGGAPRVRSGGRVSYFEEVVKVATPGRVVATSAQTYDDAPYLSTFGGAFAAAGIQMSDNARAVLRDRVNAEMADAFASRAAAEEYEKKMAVEAAAAAAEAEAAEKEESDAPEGGAAEPAVAEAEAVVEA